MQPSIATGLCLNRAPVQARARAWLPWSNGNPIDYTSTAISEPFLHFIKTTLSPLLAALPTHFMASTMDDVPHGRILELTSYIPGIYGGIYAGRPTGRAIREAVTAWAQGKESRMTPWGIQILYPDRGEYVPLMPHQNLIAICGRWIRDIGVPDDLSGHPRECTCCGRSPPKLSFPDSPYGTPAILRAFQHNEVTDPSLELMESLPTATLPDSQSTSCLFMELPPELLELILDYLVPTAQTYQFFPARKGKKSVQVVQKLFPDAKYIPMAPTTAAANSIDAILQSTPKYPATSSAYTSLAGTSKYFLDIIYSRLFAQNDFVFHLTQHTINNDIRSKNFSKIRSWTRTTRYAPKALGPLTARAAKYIRRATLIASLPFSHGSKDIKALSTLVGDAASMLSEAKLSYLGVALNVAKAGHHDNRFLLQALPVDLLQAEIDKDGVLSVQLRDPEVISVRESNKSQKVLAPLLQGPKNVKEVMLSGALSEGFVKELRSALT